ncbi:glycosyltransferase family 2 protein [Agrobacterium cavarae]|uniref:glycosyltransferase family 2 protein n=1 Tax=Agrobacterium cavarae TaxID=2528239 RepID=UPI003FD02AE0
MIQCSLNAPPEATVSAIILTYNHGDYIRECLDSVFSCQIDDMEIVVLDDCSTDGTILFLRNLARNCPRLRLMVNDTNRGNIAANTQSLIDNSRGKYILFLAGDDMLGKNYNIADAIRSLENDAELACVLPRLTFMTESTVGSNPKIYDASLLRALRSSSPNEVLVSHLFKRVSRLFLQGLIIRRSVIEEMGGFVSGTVSDDYAFFMRLFFHMRKTGQSFRFSETHTWRYRIHENNIHRNPERQFKSILEVVSTFVPAEHWAKFIWDGITFTKYDDLSQARDIAIMTLSTKAYRSLLRSISRGSLSAAGKRGDTAFLFDFISDTKNPIGLKGYAAKKVATSWFKRTTSGEPVSERQS